MATKAKRTLSYKNKSTGTDPGQNQRLSVSFKKRNSNTVTVHIAFSARSLGADSYTKSQRWNKATVFIKRKNSKGKMKTVKKHSWTYQCGPGSNKVKSHSKDFTFKANSDEDYIFVYYKNERLGTTNPWYGPKTTGVVKSTKLGKLNIVSAKRIAIHMYKGGAVGNVQGLPETYYVTKGKDFKVPSFTPVAENGGWTFKGGYDTSDSWKVIKHKYKTNTKVKASKVSSKTTSKKKKKVTTPNYVTTKNDKRKVNTTAPSIKAGATIKNVQKTKKLWACWDPVTFIYKYWPSQEAVEAYIGWPLEKRLDPNATNLPTEDWTELRQNRKKGSPGILVPDISNATANSDSKYYKRGYKFIGWKHHMYDYDPDHVDQRDAYHKIGDASQDCSRGANTNCWPVYEANTCKLYFDYGYDNRTYSLDYATDTEIELVKMCTTTNGGAVVSPSAIQYGKALLGWSLTKPDKDFYSDEDTPPEYYSYNSIWKGYADIVAEGKDNSITLYAVWGINATLYVYTENLTLTDNPGWKRAVPYVYSETDKKWHASEMNIWTSLGSNGTGWKL